jgi:sporulation protein YlmC with PRC-barrel domain
MMKIKLGISTVVLAAVCGTLQAADSSTTPDSQNQSQWQNGKLERADKIIGREIKDAQDQRIGRVKDLAVDLQNGRIVEVIVGTGGVLGVDERYVAVPPGDFTCDRATKTLQLNNADKTKLAEAPEFKLSQWDSNVGQPAVTEVYHYYGETPYFAAEVRPEHNSETGNQLGQVQRADKIIGTTVHNMQNDRLGKVDDMVVDLHSGRVVEVILATGGFLGIDNELSAVPPQAFHQGTEADTLALDTSRDTLLNAPHFKSSEWPNLDDQQYVTGVYHAYNVTPYFNTSATDNTARNAQDNGLTPMDQGSSKDDMAITREIRQQIMATPNLSVNAQNVKVITLDGRVTLRGTVNTPDEKKTLDDIATKYANGGNVNDQLMVAANPSASN